ncbi:MAG TPA: tetratricopeptide repeat protein, partial [Devosia sp.]|nr:tetratricopeptide repeat protein [Devosia sp.]
MLRAALWLAAASGAATAADNVQLQTTAEEGFGRLVLEFSGRLDLPDYEVAFDNNVLAVTFDEPVVLPLPDVAATMPDYLTIARIDPDQKGIRFGLRNPVTVHSTEAGERLFIDLMPTSWKGLPPPLPTKIVEELAERARVAAVEAEH